MNAQDYVTQFQGYVADGKISADIFANSVVPDKNGEEVSGKKLILDALEKIYVTSSIARGMIDNWIKGGQPISILSRDTPAADAGKGTIYMRLDYVLFYISNNGTVVQHTLVSMLAHELVHALLDYHDDGIGAGGNDKGNNQTDYKGKTVNYSNEIYKQLGLPEENSYIGQSEDTGLLIAGKSYTNGAEIDRSVIIGGKVANDPGSTTLATNWNSSGAGNSRDLLIGDARSNELISGSGDDFLYGNDDDDTLKGGADNDYLNGGEGEDSLFGGKGYDSYFVDTLDTIRYVVPEEELLPPEKQLNDNNEDGQGKVTMTVPTLAADGSITGYTYRELHKAYRVKDTGYYIDKYGYLYFYSVDEKGKPILIIVDGKVVDGPNGKTVIDNAVKDEPINKDSRVITIGSIEIVGGLYIRGWTPEKNLSIELIDKDDDSILIEIKQEMGDAGTIPSPIILDLDGDGVETTSLANGVYFDHAADGFAESSGWVGKDDGLLARDLNGNGQIDTGRELFGSETLLANGNKAANGFEALKQLDSNGDGVMDANDAAFSELRIWKDTNGNGQTDAGELLTLKEVIGAIANDDVWKIAA
jgi:Ca2+-binding RTX toxin-like protein